MRGLVIWGSRAQIWSIRVFWFSCFLCLNYSAGTSWVPDQAQFLLYIRAGSIRGWTACSSGTDASSRNQENCERFGTNIWIVKCKIWIGTKLTMWLRYTCVQYWLWYSYKLGFLILGFMVVEWYKQLFHCLVPVVYIIQFYNYGHLLFIYFISFFFSLFPSLFISIICFAWSQ